MARRTRKPKTTKPSRSSGGKKDPVTGLYAEIWGKTVYSDKVYDMAENGPVTQVIYEDGGGMLDFEWELGKSAISYTIKLKDAEEVDGTAMAFDESSQRLIFIGNFKYDK